MSKGETMKQKNKLLCLSIIFVALSILATLNTPMKIVAMLFLIFATVVLSVQDGLIFTAFSLIFVHLIAYSWLTAFAYFLAMLVLTSKAYILSEKRPNGLMKLLVILSILYAVVVPLIKSLVFKSFYPANYFAILTLLSAVVFVGFSYSKINIKKLAIYLVGGLVLSSVLLCVFRLSGLLAGSLKSILKEFYCIKIAGFNFVSPLKQAFSTIPRLLFGEHSGVKVDNLYLWLLCEFGLVGIVIIVGLLLSLLKNMFKQNTNRNYWVLAVTILVSVFVGVIPASLLLVFGVLSSGDNLTAEHFDDKGKFLFGYYLIVKRAFDIVVSLIGLVVASIPMIVVAVLVKATSKGTVFFKDKRIGKDGKTITVLKFRSMYKDAEARLEQYLTKEQLEMWKKERKVDNDPRITKVGKFIRKTSLDELPQLFNILKGDLSIVGNRPLSKLEYDTYFDDKDKKVLDSMQPGLTGYWQAYGRSNVTFLSGERQKMYIYYTKNASIKLDIKIFFKTIAVVLKHDGAK